VIIGLILEVLYTDMALLVNKIKRQPMMILVGILIIILSLRTLSNYYYKYSNYNGFLLEKTQSLFFGRNIIFWQ
jgi:hypothetical protein